MYNVLIVDDERIIREGIATMVDWESRGLKLAGMAQNGLEAFEAIVGCPPDIVITDIKMPGMDGLELIAKAKELKPELNFIILSGYSEFEFAKKAIRYGVEDYLLKPCSEVDIEKALDRVVARLKQKESREEFVRAINYKLEKVMPQVKEQFLRDLAVNGLYSSQACGFFKQLFGLEDDRYRLVLFEIEKDNDFYDRFALKNIAEEVFLEGRGYLSTITAENVLILCGSIPSDQLFRLISRIKVMYRKYYSSDISVSISEEEVLENIPQMYAETLECMKFKFYLGKGGIITKKDLGQDRAPAAKFPGFNPDRIGSLVRAGDNEGVMLELESLFDSIKSGKYEIAAARTFCIELMLSILKQGSEGEMDQFARHILNMQAMDTFEQLFSYISEAAYAISNKNYEDTSKKHIALVETIIRLVEENCHRPEFSLNWLAKEAVYMNVDYLSKLFYKETREKFSQYVLRIRMEKAKFLIEKEAEFKIYEVAEKVGFGDNSQYFSQVFKKFTGLTPKEYKNSVS